MGWCSEWTVTLNFEIIDKVFKSDGGVELEATDEVFDTDVEVERARETG